MVNLSYDLHIHSCLSPCGDDESTPANIVGMAVVNGLDVIALTDHNACRNCVAAKRAADEYGILFIPGMELTTSEEVHVVCLFETLEDALEWDRHVYERLIKIDNKPDIFGNQILYDENDEIAGYEEKLLINATDIGFDEVWDEVARFHGVMFPAHLDKSTTSLLSNLGMIPPDSKFRTAELKNIGRLHALRKEHPYLSGCRIISNSDAHQIIDIREPDLTIPVKEKTVRAVLDYIRNEDGDRNGIGEQPLQ